MMLDPLFDMLFSSWGVEPRAVCDFFSSVPVLKLIHYLSLCAPGHERLLSDGGARSAPGHDSPHRMLKGGGSDTRAERHIFICRSAHFFAFRESPGLEDWRK